MESREDHTMDTIKVLGISGSPRLGNSLYLLKKALAKASDVDCARVLVDTYLFKGKKFDPCIGCGKCGHDKHKGECIIKDDFVTLRDLWLNADVILYALPVYHVGIPGQLKCFIDRLGNTIGNRFTVRSPRFLKVIGAITQGAHFAGGQELATNFIIQHAVLKNCIPVSGDGWQSYLGASGWTVGDLCRDALQRQFDKGDYDAQVAIHASETLGRRAVELAVLLKAGGRAIYDRFRTKDEYVPFLNQIDPT